MAESRQKKEYFYEGKNSLANKLNILKGENIKEPILMTLLKNILNSVQRKYTLEKGIDNNFRDEQNCTYIVHEDSSSGTSISQSDNSCDEKNKLHLRLQLDNSDTDTSSDSTRDKFSSEYIPSAHVTDGTKVSEMPSHRKEKKENIYPEKHIIYKPDVKNTHYMHELKLNPNNSSSDSTSYLDLKPYNPIDKRLLNISGLPIQELEENDLKKIQVADETSVRLSTNVKSVIVSPANVSNILPMSAKSEVTPAEISYQNKKDESINTEEETEYSYDFTGSPVTKNKDNFATQIHSSNDLQDESETKSPNNMLDSPHTHSSHSSISISDVADLISEKSSIDYKKNKDQNQTKQSLSSPSKKVSKEKLSDDSGDFSESPIPSLSNLSLDLHSD